MNTFSFVALFALVASVSSRAVVNRDLSADASVIAKATLVNSLQAAQSIVGLGKTVSDDLSASSKDIIADAQKALADVSTILANETESSRSIESEIESAVEAAFSKLRGGSAVAQQIAAAAIQVELNNTNIALNTADGLVDDVNTLAQDIFSNVDAGLQSVLDGLSGSDASSRSALTDTVEQTVAKTGKAAIAEVTALYKSIGGTPAIEGAAEVAVLTGAKNTKSALTFASTSSDSVNDAVQQIIANNVALIQQVGGAVAAAAAAAESRDLLDEAESLTKSVLASTHVSAGQAKEVADQMIEHALTQASNILELSGKVLDSTNDAADEIISNTQTNLDSVIAQLEKQ